MNALQIVDALVAAGVPEPQAKAHARIITEAVGDGELVTKKDFKVGLAELETRLIKWIIGAGLAAVAAGIFG